MTEQTNMATNSDTSRSPAAEPRRPWGAPTGPRQYLLWLAILPAMAAVVLLVWRQPPRATHLGGPGEFGPVEQTYRVIRESYYRPLDANVLQRAAVRGMVGELDEFSAYIPPDKVEALTERVMGMRRDLGLEWTLQDGVPTVLGPLPDSPAHKAGLFRGDRILEINARPVSSLREKEIRSLLQPIGKETVELTVQDAVAGTSRLVRLQTETYPVETVQGWQRNEAGAWQHVLDERRGLYYVRLTEFCSDTARRLATLLRGWVNLRGLVLDLRDNPGGLLPDGVAVADMFLREGEIVHVRERGNRRQTYRAHGETPYAAVPMVVLIDEATTSAAEIVAGALSANARAVLAGQRTRGKGLVQTMLRLPNDLGQIHLTTAEFFLPPHRAIQRRRGAKTWGVEPQVSVLLSDEQRETLRRLRREQSVLPRPSSEANPTGGTKTAASQPVERRKKGEEDPQLSAATALLKHPRRMRKILAELAEHNRREREAFRRKPAAGPERETAP